MTSSIKVNFRLRGKRKKKRKERKEGVSEQKNWRKKNEEKARMINGVTEKR